MKSTKQLARELGLLRKRSSCAQTRQQRQSKARQIFAYLVILDFESTCWKDGKHKTQEIIEFPAVLMNTTTGKILSEFHYYVQPVECPTLSDFCKELTGITQDQVAEGIPLSVCLSKFRNWLRRLSEENDFVYNTPTDDGQLRCTFVTWSDWDLGVCLQYEARRKQLRKPMELNSWIDLRATYRKFYERIPKGLNGALQDLGLDFEGREHSGIVDTKNTARLAYRMICDGCVMNITKSIEGSLNRWTKPAAPVVLGNNQAAVSQHLNEHHKELASHHGTSVSTCAVPQATHEVTSLPHVQPQPSGPSSDSTIAENKSGNSSDKTKPNADDTVSNTNKTKSDKTKSNNLAHCDLTLTTPDMVSENVCGTDVRCDVNIADRSGLKRSNTALACHRKQPFCGTASATASPRSKKGKISNSKSFVVYADPVGTCDHVDMFDPDGTLESVSHTLETSDTTLHSSSTGFRDVTNVEPSVKSDNSHLKNISIQSYKPPIVRHHMRPISLVNNLAVQQNPHSEPGRKTAAIQTGLRIFKTPLPLMPLGVSTMKRTPPMCTCGRRAKRKCAQNPGPNLGRFFFCCGAGVRKNGTFNNCKFFKWETDLTKTVGASPALRSETCNYNIPYTNLDRASSYRTQVTPHQILNRLKQPDFSTPQSERPTTGGKKTLGIKSCGFPAGTFIRPPTF